MDSTFTLRVATELKQAFEETAKGNDRSGSQLLRDYMRDYIRKHAQAELKLGTTKPERRSA